ncbi:hypothetical protein DRE_03719 [Drechslerella stenobrocha 248]|uniref:Uncharacterized protein n=1 Tax=Drechslerella stenobrocha 248 TaxID=1043628 RepID=W7I3K8_9PEZI|nr:hypothetical protein DRE_03719 [Drechslerella stenobrocha 248]
MTRYNAEGVNCYYEYFAPSVAFKEDLTTFFYQHPLYCPGRASPIKESLAREELGRNDPRMVQLGKIATGCTYFYDKKYSQRFWQEWFDDPGTCRPPALVHPVKGDFFN